MTAAQRHLFSSLLTGTLLSCLTDRGITINSVLHSTGWLCVDSNSLLARMRLLCVQQYSHNWQAGLGKKEFITQPCMDNTVGEEQLQQKH
jgi:hypothetical protein